MPSNIPIQYTPVQFIEQSGQGSANSARFSELAQKNFSEIGTVGDKLIAYYDKKRALERQERQEYIRNLAKSSINQAVQDMVGASANSGVIEQLIYPQTAGNNDNDKSYSSINNINFQVSRSANNNIDLQEINKEQNSNDTKQIETNTQEQSAENTKVDELPAPVENKEIQNDDTKKTINTSTTSNTSQSNRKDLKEFTNEDRLDYMSTFLALYRDKHIKEMNLDKWNAEDRALYLAEYDSGLMLQLKQYEDQLVLDEYKARTGGGKITPPKANLGNILDRIFADTKLTGQTGYNIDLLKKYINQIHDNINRGRYRLDIDDEVKLSYIEDNLNNPNIKEEAERFGNLINDIKVNGVKNRSYLDLQIAKNQYDRLSYIMGIDISQHPVYIDIVNKLNTFENEEEFYNNMSGVIVPKVRELVMQKKGAGSYNEKFWGSSNSAVQGQYSKCIQVLATFYKEKGYDSEKIPEMVATAMEAFFNTNSKTKELVPAQIYGNNFTIFNDFLSGSQNGKNNAVIMQTLGELTPKDLELLRQSYYWVSDYQFGREKANQVTK